MKRINTTQTLYITVNTIVVLVMWVWSAIVVVELGVPRWIGAPLILLLMVLWVFVVDKLLSFVTNGLIDLIHRRKP